MSSVYGAEFSGIKAVDGIYVPSDSGVDEHASLAHTKRELSPWIQVDLSVNHFVEGVKIWNRFESSYPRESI